MSLFDRFGENGKPHFLSDSNNGTPRAPKKSPAIFYLNKNYDEWPDRIFLAFVRDRLVWLHCIDENDPIILRLVDLIHRTDPDQVSNVV